MGHEGRARHGGSGHRRRRLARLTCALAIGALIALPGVTASARTAAAADGGGTAVFHTASPSCTFTLSWTLPRTRGLATAIKGQGSATCDGQATYPSWYVALVDNSLLGPPNAEPGFEVALGSFPPGPATTPSVVSYPFPKTSHHYDLRFFYSTQLAADAVVTPSPNCQEQDPGSDRFWNCQFDGYFTVDAAPLVAPPEAPLPATSQVTLTTTTGDTCQLKAQLSSPSTGALALGGTTECAAPESFALGATFLYADRAESTELTAGSCCEGDVNSAGQFPAVPGRSYSLTYYVAAFFDTTTLPPQCFNSGFGVLCEVSVSGRAP